MTQRELLAETEATHSPEMLKTYLDLAGGQANLLASHGFNDEAEAAYRLSAQFWPENPKRPPISPCPGTYRCSDTLEVAFANPPSAPNFGSNLTCPRNGP